MLFAGLLAAWYDLRGATAVWPPAGTSNDVTGATIGTVVLGLGSVTMGIAQHSARRKHRRLARAMLLTTFAFAVAFAIIALRDWSDANFHVDTSAYGTMFYVITGTHLAHVVAGAVLLLAMAIFLARPAFEADQQAGVEAIGYYWHFVFVIWVAVWATIYLVK
jgi:heme/copper-type cytochrome/quinol oxidase subunit 3